MIYQLYTFPASHYCEKARWALDYKGLSYEEVSWIPVFHILKVKGLPVPQTSVPILFDGKEYVQGSSEIMKWLEERHPDRPLFPKDADALEKAQAIDATLSKLGVHVRRYVYWVLLPENAAGQQALGLNLSGLRRKSFNLSFPLLRAAIFKGLNINAESSQRSLEKIEKGLEEFEEVRAGKHYLIKDQLSFVDLSAASLLSPLNIPLQHPIYTQLPIPQSFEPILEKFRRHDALKWVVEIYQKHRK